MGVVTNSSAFICRFVIDPERRDEFISTARELWNTFSSVIESEMNFLYCGSGRNPNELYILESWKSEEATERVRADPRFGKGFAEMVDCCLEPMTLQLLSGLDGNRSIFDAFPAGPSEHHPNRGAPTTTFL
ncbi:MAG TPA: hypothetical protein VGL34_21725 [Steroidobacteraceae bacterium]